MADPGWHVLIPAKDTAIAKSRLAEAFGQSRREFALAFALDTVEAVVRCSQVSAVWVVSGDRSVADAVGGLALRNGGLVRVVDEGPVGELNAAITFALADVAADQPVAVLLADLPALRPVSLTRALRLARRYDTAFVADFRRSGTTLLTAQRPVLLRPQFGPGSASAHALLGAKALRGFGLATLRRDVDTPDDLTRARRLGLGVHTATVLHELTGR